MPGLKKEVGLFGATAYILGVIVGAGIYVIIGEAAGIAGNALWLSFLIAAAIAAFTGLSYAELASTFPRDSAEYLYSEKAFHDRKFSFGIAWLKFIGLVIGASAVSLGFGGYLSLLTGWNMIFCSLLLIAIVSIFNLYGVKKALTLDIILVIVAVAGLLFVIGFGASSIGSVEDYTSSPSGFGGIITGAALIFFAFLGFENIGNIAEEVKKPKHTLPLALFISVIISTLLYVLVALVAVSVVPWEELAHSTAPLSTVMTALMGSKTGILLAVMALAATGSTVIGLLIAGSRMMYGLAEEHSFPSVFLRLNKRGVPFFAVLLTALISVAFVLPGNIAWVAFLTDFSALFIFLVVNLCVITLRYRMPDVPRGFRIPFNIGRLPVFPVLGAFTCGALLFSFDKKVFLIGLLMLFLGIGVYMIFAYWENHNHINERIGAANKSGAKKKTVRKSKR